VGAPGLASETWDTKDSTHKFTRSKPRKRRTPGQVSKQLFRLRELLQVHAVALTSEPEERFLRKLSSASWAVVTLPELSAVPICVNRSWNEVVLPDVSDVLSVLLDVPPAELLVVFSRLVSVSYADCALETLPELMALKRLSTSCPSALMPELPVPSLLVPEVDDELEVDVLAAVLGVA